MRAPVSRSGGQRRQACRGKFERRKPFERRKVLKMGMITKPKTLPTDPVFCEHQSLIFSNLLCGHVPRGKRADTLLLSPLTTGSQHKFTASSQPLSLTFTRHRHRDLEPSAFLGHGVRRKDEFKALGYRETLVTTRHPVASPPDT